MRRLVSLSFDITVCYAEETPMTHTILVVDDEPEIVRFVRAYLEDAGYRVVTANDSQQAVVALRTFADEPLEGTVEAIVPQDVTAATNAHFTVHVRLSPTGLRLLPGLTGRVEIFAGE